MVKIVIGALVSCVAGGLEAWHLTKYTTRYGVGLLAAWGMIGLGSILIPFAGLNAKDQQPLILAIYVGLANLGFVLASKFEKHIEVVMTAFIGSYLIVQGISFYTVGGFTFKPNREFYFYLSGLIILFILGVMGQNKLKRAAVDRDDFKIVGSNSD